MKPTTVLLALAVSLRISAAGFAADSFTVNVVCPGVPDAIPPGQAFTYMIEGLLTNESNEGLCFFAYDLEVIGPSAYGVIIQPNPNRAFVHAFKQYRIKTRA